MTRHRRSAPCENDDSSSSDDDAFSALSRKKKKGIINTPSAKSPILPFGSTTIAAVAVADDSTAKSANADTSSNKRHHHQSTQRKSKMDALLQELQETPISGQVSSHNKPTKAPPEKTGSYCLPGEETSTTNIFVGNLSPLTTEEQLSDIFRQFGDLYSVKIMWPRTPEEQSRGRNTGFVCFMNRSDAQDAMDALQDSDPLNTGWKMFLNWGKNVKKVVKRGAGGVPIPPIRGVNASFQEDTGMNSNTETESRNKHFKNNDGIDQVDSNYSNNPLDEVIYDPKIHGFSAVRVVPPCEPSRFKFISTVAMFVAKDGSILENKLIEKEANNPKFSFLMDHQEEHQEGCSISEVARNERIFYLWKVFSFSQGDSYGSWRTDPFIMIKPSGNFWIPPDRDPELLAQVQKEEERNEEQMQLMKQQRRNMIAARRGGYRPAGNDLQNNTNVKSSDGSVMLSPDQVAQWEHMIQNLCCSREAICEAMAFCFDNSIAAQQICKLLEIILLDYRPGVSIETKCARLYLVSDILFNSQQPGVKNAFRYRDAIEEMAPEVFQTLGRHGNGGAGRLSMNKLRIAVRNVLNAWNSWSVYSDIFLDRLEALFEGKTVTTEDDESKHFSNNTVPPPPPPSPPYL
mmetsp:Transcript_8563/g.16155  ORF Transcript_8563/g.16155 Transcript_8563/m.16155 type:complete len:629 (-) Transcript_8563:156-2042(-)